MKSALRDILAVAIMVIGLNHQAVASPDYPDTVVSAFNEICNSDAGFEERVIAAKQLGMKTAPDDFEAVFTRDLQYEADKEHNLVFSFDEGGMYFLGLGEGFAKSIFSQRRSADCFVIVVQENHKFIRDKFRTLLKSEPSSVTDTAELSADVWSNILAGVLSGKQEVFGFRSTLMKNKYWLVTLSRYEGKIN